MISNRSITSLESNHVEKDPSSICFAPKKKKVALTLKCKLPQLPCTLVALFNLHDISVSSQFGARIRAIYASISHKKSEEDFLSSLSFLFFSVDPISRILGQIGLI